MGYWNMSRCACKNFAPRIPSLSRFVETQSARTKYASSNKQADYSRWLGLAEKQRGRIFVKGSKVGESATTRVVEVQCVLEAAT